ncbi:MAG TPA: hypothetical protein VMS17_33900 [Gemmataceae bacterium]|nr:hypothetical protein [Gemmataceae bacterium]
MNAKPENPAQPAAANPPDPPATIPANLPNARVDGNPQPAPGFIRTYWRRYEWPILGIPLVSYLLCLPFLRAAPGSDLIRYIHGYAFSVLLGAFCSRVGWYAFHWMADRIKLEQTPDDNNPKQTKLEEREFRTTLMPITLGVIERIVITTLVGFGVGGSAGFIGAWITIKAVGGWGRIAGPKSTPYQRAIFMAGLLSSIWSAFFGVVGGLFILPK